MWRAGSGRGDEVTCIACGDAVSREDAREYDKYGDRWDRRDKTFEYLCKPCHRECCHQPRAGLEALLADAGAGERDRETFLAHFAELVRERHGVEEP
jgi:hypothetical protein